MSMRQPGLSNRNIPDRNLHRNDDSSPPVPEPKVETPKEDLVTQEIEESVAIEEAKKKKKKKSNARKKKRKRKEEAEKNASARRKPRRNALPKNAARKNRPSATRSQVLSE